MTFEEEDPDPLIDRLFSHPQVGQGEVEIVHVSGGKPKKGKIQPCS